MNCQSRSIHRTATVLGALCVAIFCQPASAQELIQNGGFESGSLGGWTPAAKGDGNFYLGDKSMPDGFGGFLTPGTQSYSVGPKSGQFCAVSDASSPTLGGPGARVLTQMFSTPGSFASLLLNFDMFVNDYNGAGPMNVGGALDPAQMTPTQYARVDILTAGADPFSIASGDIVDNLYLGEDAGNPPNAYSHYSFDLSSILNHGTSYQLRFAEVDNQFVINQGVDNVSLFAVTPEIGPVATPEFGSVFSLGGLLLAGGAGVWLQQWRRRNRTSN